MSSILPDRPETTGWLPETVRLPEPERAEEAQRRRWRVRTAQWRALELARDLFGAEVEATLEGSAGPGPFQGLLRLAVPFQDLEAHRRRERVFTALAGLDPVLRHSPLVYVFEPRTA